MYLYQLAFGAFPDPSDLLCLIVPAPPVEDFEGLETGRGSFASGKLALSASTTAALVTSGLVLAAPEALSVPLSADLAEGEVLGEPELSTLVLVSEGVTVGVVVSVVGPIPVFVVALLAPVAARDLGLIVSGLVDFAFVVFAPVVLPVVATRLPGSDPTVESPTCGWSPIVSVLVTLPHSLFPVFVIAVAVWGSGLTSCRVVEPSCLAPIVVPIVPAPRGRSVIAAAVAAGTVVVTPAAGGPSLTSLTSVLAVVVVSPFFFPLNGLVYM